MVLNNEKKTAGNPCGFVVLFLPKFS